MTGDLDPRLAALSSTALLDTPPEETFDRLTRLVTRLVGVPIALVSLVDRDRQFFKSQHGLAAPWAVLRETPLSHSFCQHVTLTGQPLVIPDAADEPLVQANLARRDLGVVAYLGMPLVTREGHVLGSLCAIDSKRRDWTDEDIATMRDLAAIAMTEIALRAQMAERERAESRLALMAHELQHRVKNSLATVQAVVLMSIRGATRLEGLAEIVGGRLAALASTHDLLTVRDGRSVALQAILDRELAAFGAGERISLAGPALDFDEDQGIAMSMILHELATNASKYGALVSTDGLIRIDWSLSDPDGRAFRFTWRESGVALEEGERRKGFGSTLIERLANTSLGGSVAMVYGRDGVCVTIEGVLRAQPS